MSAEDKMELQETTKNPVQESGPDGTKATVSSEESPSEDKTLMGKLMDVRSQSKDKKDMVCKLGILVFTNYVSTGIVAALCFVFSIAYIGFGSGYLHQCHRQRMIPIYLIVEGCFAMMKGIFHVVEMLQRKRSQDTQKKYKRSKYLACCDFPLSAFLFAWFIAGNLWIFSVKETPYVYNCHPTLHGFAVWTTIILWILILLPIFLCGCMTCIVCLGIFKPMSVVTEAPDKVQVDKQDKERIGEGAPGKD